MSKNRLYIMIALLSIILLVGNGYAQDSNQRAKLVLDKFFSKYEKLFSAGLSNINTVICKMSIKGVGKLDQSRSSTSAPMLIDTKAELYVANPNKMLLNLKGNMGNITIVIPDKKPMAAVTLFPDSKQFAAIGVPERMLGGIVPNNRERFWQESVLSYAGLVNTKQGKTHKIIVKSNRPTHREVTVIHILDGRWDPVRIEHNDPKSGSATVDFDQILFNPKIAPEKFIPNTRGYTQVSSEQLTGIIMMNIMASSMIKKPIK